MARVNGVTSLFRRPKCFPLTPFFANAIESSIELGHGGMGAVYQAMDENLNCVVAVKETFAKTEEHRRAFRREAELLANLNHPTLPKVMDHFTQGEGQFLVMQFFSGHDLAELLELREQPFAVDKVLGWAEQLLDALEELHSYDPPIVHRDIKPSNLKVTPKGRVVSARFWAGQGTRRGKCLRRTPTANRKASTATRPIMRRSNRFAARVRIRAAISTRLPPRFGRCSPGRFRQTPCRRVGEKEEGKPDPLDPAHELNSGSPAVCV